jgi:DnaJ-class molecular chaperone
MAVRSQEDYYRLLGVEVGVDDDELRRAWRKLALEWHPDRAGPGATAVFQQISLAYAVLSDPDARAAYDKWRGIQAPARPKSEDMPRRAPGTMLSRLSGPLNALLARGVADYAKDDLIDLFLEPQEASEGGMIRISMRVPVHCTACAATPNAPCVVCNGEREVEDLFSAWLAARPGVADGTILTPSAWLPGMVTPVYFRVRLPSA